MSSSMLALFWRKKIYLLFQKSDWLISYTKMFVIARGKQWNLVNLCEYANWMSQICTEYQVPSIVCTIMILILYYQVLFKPQGCPNSRPSGHTYQCTCHVSSPSLWWGDILGLNWNRPSSKLSVACRLLQATPTPQGERGCSCNLFPSRPKWSLGQQALQTGRPKLGLGGGRGMRGK